MGVRYLIRKVLRKVRMIFASKNSRKPTRLDHSLTSLFKKISDDQKSRIEAPFSEQEIKSAVWSCGNNKARGPDGFTFDWHHVGNDFVEAVMFIKSNCQINRGSNSSLIGCITKVISKILAGRFKEVLVTIISNSQTAFIKGRNILDSPLMVNELISRAKNRKKNLLIFKADFAKAFDSLNWNFLDNVFMQMGFGHKWRAWVNGFISMVNVSILINGSPTKEFTFEKGVRQGDPLTPFLFLVAAEGLSIVLREAQQANLLKGVRLECSNAEVSILQFADDTIFLGEWTRDNAKNLIRILKCFRGNNTLRVSVTTIIRNANGEYTATAPPREPLLDRLRISRIFKTESSGILATTLRSVIKFLSQTASFAASKAAMYSASVVESAIVSCFELFHEIAPPFRVLQNVLDSHPMGFTWVLLVSSRNTYLVSNIEPDSGHCALLSTIPCCIGDKSFIGLIHPESLQDFINTSSVNFPFRKAVLTSIC
ncbi:hypothetical protein OSB04_019964 [Centaurea solstitialis]|uniref:Reverse transcriptase domain-containing protein n=1 Tax=Centaurea solstitialis TaxID=347529 RepID=A0AA38T2S3_9ASTR|nr:hypothetical protein OSB04_019964 [Centaurea solstitialis]